MLACGLGSAGVEGILSICPNRDWVQLSTEVAWAELSRGCIFLSMATYVASRLLSPDPEARGVLCHNAPSHGEVVVVSADALDTYLHT